MKKIICSLFLVILAFSTANANVSNKGSECERSVCIQGELIKCFMIVYNDYLKEFPKSKKGIRNYNFFVDEQDKDLVIEIELNGDYFGGGGKYIINKESCSINRKVFFK